MTETTPPTAEQLAEWKRLTEAASGDRWVIGDEGELLIDVHGARATLLAYPKVPPPDCLAEFRWLPDRAFVAAARLAMPTLLAEVERLTAERDRLHALLERCCGNFDPRDGQEATDV